MDRSVRSSLRGIAWLLVALLVPLASFDAAAQGAFPSKPVRFVVPFPPGGTNDTLARLLGTKLAALWGQPVVVDNRAGANGAIGTDIAAKSPGDGYTMLMTSDTHVITPLLTRTPYDPIADFAPVALVATTEIMLVVNPQVPANSLAEFIALAKAKPGQINFASPGNGNSLHLIGELFQSMTGTRMVHVPYKGAGPAVADLIGGQVQAFFSPPINVVQHAKAGKLKALAVSGSQRLAAMPEVPTFAEAGLAGFDVRVWQGVLVPASTPKDVVAKIAADLDKVMRDDGVKGDLLKGGMDSTYVAPDRFAETLRADTAKYRKIITDANVKLD
jgi:tripartite-type tricarboxylate transporter receptor subunit TctC